MLGACCFGSVRADQPSTANSQTEPKADMVIPIWPDSPPQWNAPTEAEKDTSGPDGRNVAGRSVIRLGNVSVPQLHVYIPQHGSSDTIVLIAPGGGYNILAWDLEGTEIAQWLNEIGVAAAVLKYRVPTKREEVKWLAPVQDIQRSISLVRSGQISGVQAKTVGVLGFSAGGNASARAAFSETRHYEPIDSSDEVSIRPDFGVLIYPAWLNREGTTDLIDELSVNENTPPMFLAHAADDNVSALSSVAIYTALHQNKVPASLHVFGSGGHGFGGRTDGKPTDAWPDLCATWLRSRGWARPVAIAP
ncbi:alpha/beta hydrolase [Rubripirellula amarantea]|nr:alpha/beta hydrolase [Rubripirellula amarantea]